MAVEKFTLRIDENEFTIGDLEDFEDVAGVSFIDAMKPVPAKDADGNQLFDEKGRPETTVDFSPKTLKALVWITKRREVPGFSVEDARNVRVAAMELVPMGAELDPKEAVA